MRNWNRSSRTCSPPLRISLSNGFHDEPEFILASCWFQRTPVEYFSVNNADALTKGQVVRFIVTREYKMIRAATWLPGVALIGLLVVAVGARADEEKIDLDKVPKPVMDAVKAKFPGAKLTGASKEKEGDKTIYEVAFTYKGSKYEVECEPNGKFVAIDREIEAKDLPKPVATALEGKYPKATYKIIEEVTKDDKIAYYEVELVTADKKGVEVQVDPSGKIVKEEKKK